jgi:uncharacterized protein (TIGR00369 family)
MPDASERLNAHLSGYDRAMGLRFVRATPEEIVAEYVIGEQHRQPYGIVHGGVHCGMVEATCSTGAGLAAVARGLGGVVGIENHTSFVHAARAGRIQVRATPLTRGRLSQLWEAVCTDDDGRVVAQGQVRLLCLEAGATLAGKPLSGRAGSDNPLLPEGEA